MFLSIIDHAMTFFLVISNYTKQGKNIRYEVIKL